MAKKELPLHEAGLNAVFVDDVAPYRVRKVRILNGAHTAMTPVAYLAGLDTVREAAEDDLVGSFVKDLLTYEVIPTIDLPEQQLTAYADEILDRFRNPFIRHQLLDISLNSFAKFKVRNLPVIMEHLNKNGKLPQRTVFALGALICFYKGKRGHSDIPLADDPETLSFLKMIWTDETDAAEIARRVLGSEKLWGQNLNEWPDLAAMVAQHIEDIEQTGMTESLKKLMNSQRLKLGDLS